MASKRKKLVWLVHHSEYPIAPLRAVLADLPEYPIEIMSSTLRPGLGLANADSMPEVVIIPLEPDPSGALAFIESLRPLPNRPTILALSSDASRHTLFAATSAGADDVVFLPCTEVELLQAILRISRDGSTPGDSKSARGQLVSLMSLSGGVGTTLVATNLALEIRRSTRRSVLLIDLDLQAGDVAAFMNIEPPMTISDAVSGNRLDSIGLQSLLSSHPSGVQVLSAPLQIEDAEQVKVETLRAIFELSGDLFEYVVMDLGSTINEPAMSALEASDVALYVMEQTLPSVRAASRTFDLIKRLELKRPELLPIVNKFGGSQEISINRISQTLNKPVYATIARDDARALQAINFGQPLHEVSSRSPLTRSVQRLAAALAPARQREETRSLLDGVMAGLSSFNLLRSNEGRA